MGNLKEETTIIEILGSGDSRGDSILNRYTWGITKATQSTKRIVCEND